MKRKETGSKPPQSRDTNQLVLQFLQVTNTEDVAQARHMLEANNWSVDDAVSNLYDNSPLPPPSKRPRLDPSSSSSSNIQELTDPISSPQTSSKRSSNRITNNRSNKNTTNNNTTTTTQQSVFDAFRDFSSESFPEPTKHHHQRNTSHPQNSTSSSSKSSNQQQSREEYLIPDDEDDTNQIQKGSHSSSTSKYYNKLQLLTTKFRPPIDILFKGSLEQAKQSSIQQHKPLLLNLQSTTDFQSQILNRDTWSNPQLKQLILKEFVFWQVYLHTDEGMNVKGWYGVENAPFVAILDPVTGECLMEIVKGEFITADQVMALVQSFLTTFKDKPFHSTFINTNPTAERTKKDTSNKEVVDLTEDEQLKAALEASLVDLDNNNNSDRIEEETEVKEEKEEEKEKEKEEEKEKEKEIEKEKGKEEEQERITEVIVKKRNKGKQIEGEQGKPKECQIQIRMIDGKNIRGEFTKQDTLWDVDDWIQSNNSTEQKENSTNNNNNSNSDYVLVSPFPRVEYSDFNKTLEELGLVGRSSLIMSAKKK